MLSRVASFAFDLRGAGVFPRSPVCFGGDFLDALDFGRSAGHNPLDFFRCMRSNRDFFFLNPDYMGISGIYLFCGSQGSGKSISAISALWSIMAEFPHAVICSNLELYGLPEGFSYVPFEDCALLTELDNGYGGVIFLIDEIQLVWSSLESRGMTPADLAVFCQMRKSRRVILGTSQVYGRVAKGIREQMTSIIDCKNYLRYIQVNKVYNPQEMPNESISDTGTSLDAGSLIGSYWFFHSPRLYRAYDTMIKLERPQNTHIAHSRGVDRGGV